MVVEESAELEPVEAVSDVTAELAVRIYELHGLMWPVSGDATTRAGNIVHRHRCPLLSQGGGIRRRGVAGGWLRRAAPAELVRAVRCAACPWGLDVQGDDADAVAVRVACRHSDKTGHAVEVAGGKPDGKR